MKIETLNKIKAHGELRNWLINTDILPNIPEDYEPLRKSLKDFHVNAESFSSSHGDRKQYAYDIDFGIQLYVYLDQKDWVSANRLADDKKKWSNLRRASDDEFWIYISVKVIPDIVKKRFEGKSESVLDERFFKTPARIWLKTLWWFIHLSWQDDAEKTKEFLMKDVFNNDVMTNITERTGKNGMYIDVYREIISAYGNKVSKEELIKYKKSMAKGDTDTLMRAVMRLHTARVMVVDPCLYEGGIQGYVCDLFREFTEKLKNS